MIIAEPKRKKGFPPANAGDARDKGSIPGLGRPPGGGMATHSYNSCLENPMNREAWRATVRRVAQSRTWRKQLSTHRERHFGGPSVPTIVYSNKSIRFKVFLEIYFFPHFPLSIHPSSRI